MIGLIPLGGNATRMNGIPKHLLPVGDTFLLKNLMQEMNNGGAEPIVIGSNIVHMPYLRSQWHDMYSGEGRIYEVNTETMSQTLLHGREYCGDETVLFGMPDTYWADENIYPFLLSALAAQNCIATVALWEVPRDYRSKRGMCVVGSDMLIREVVDKPIHTGLTWGWGAIVWRFDFWQYINPYDKHVGFALQRAIDDGQRVRGLYQYGKFYDCGTPDEYYDLIREQESTHATL